MTDEPLESKFLKSKENRRTENAGLTLLCSDPRFQVLGPALRASLIQRLGVTATTRAFDAVMTPEPAEPITAFNLESMASSIVLVEMKTTLVPIWDERLEGFFFGVTENEMNLAAALGEKYVFAFVVLSHLTAYDRPFFVLLTKTQLEERIHARRTQYQVTLARGRTYSGEPFGVGPGQLVRPLLDDTGLF